MEKISGTSALREGEKFTLEQWRSWPEGEKWELIGGVAYNMCPSPRVTHERLAARLFNRLSQYLENKTCEPFIAPVDVFLPGAVDGSEDTVVIPDVFVVCDPSKIEEDGIHGAPDFIAEVLSPSTAYKDMNEKKELYENAGVKEYWLISPKNGSIFQYVLSGNRFGPATEILPDQKIKSAAISGFEWMVER